MALNTKYVVGINLNDYFVNKDTGLPLAGGKIFFKKDNNRSVGKFVYRLTGSPPNYTYTALPNPITLSSVGTVAVSPTDATNVAVYFYPYDENGDLDLYYIQVTDAAGNIQLERQAWPNVSANVNPLNNVSGESDNQILNSQFVDVNFEQDYGTLLEWTGAIVNRVFPLAPGWDMIVSASDTSSIQVDRLELAGSLNINTNPPYALEVLPQGASISSIKLRQTLDMNPAIWANNSLSGFMLISSLDALAHTIEMTYSTSIPNIPQTVISASTGTTGYVNAAGVLALTGSSNTDAPPEGATYIDILLPRTGHVAISSIQVLPVLPNSDAASYIQNSVHKQQSDLFTYYNPLIQQVPVPSISEGWDFKVNPHQFGSTVAMGAIGSASKYLWDQTIGWQSVTSLFTATESSPRALQINTATTGQLALIQYIGGPQLRQLLSNDFSVLIKAFSNLVGGAKGTVSFWVTTDVSLPDMGSNLSIVSTLDAQGKPATFHGNWSEIPRNYRGDARFTIPYSNPGEMFEIPLEGWNKTSRALDATYTYAAIVVGFESAASTFEYLCIDSISVTPGLLARPYAPLSYDLTLAQMRTLYEKSYLPNVLTGVVTNVNQILYGYAAFAGHVVGPSTDYSVTSFGIIFKASKRVVPFITLFSAGTGASGMVTVSTTDGASEDVPVTSGFTLVNSLDQISYVGGNSSTVSGTLPIANPYLRFHYEANARYGYF